MATFEASLQELLGSLVSGRCYPVVSLVYPAISPYITFQVVFAAPLLIHDHSLGIQYERLQIDVWARDYNEAKGLAREVKTAMDNATFPNVIIMAQDLFEEVSREFRVLLEYQVWPL